MSATAAVEMPEISETGLTVKEVSQRIESGQSNAVKTSTSRSVKDIVRANVFTLFNGIIFVAMVMVLVTGSWRDAVFGFVIIINTGIGIFTELKAKRTLDKLSILVASDFLVRRDGEDVEVPHNEIVLGDLLWIRSGEQVPADGQIIQTWGLELDESMAHRRIAYRAPQSGGASLFRSHCGFRHGVGQGQCRGQPLICRHAHRSGQGL